MGKLDPGELTKKPLVLSECLCLGDDLIRDVTEGTPGDEWFPVLVQSAPVHTPGNNENDSDK